MNRTQESGINVHLFPGLSRHYSTRMLRVTGGLAKWGIFDHIYLVAMASSDVTVIETIDAKRSICHLGVPFKNSRSLLPRLLRFLAWYVAVIRRFRRERLTCINSHSLATLPLGVILKALTRARLVYDTHELETETLNMRGVRRLLGKATEAVFIRFADSVAVVGPMIADWYRGRYLGVDPVVVRNLPEEEPTIERQDLFRTQCNIPSDAIIFFYQGELAEARGINVALEAFAHSRPDRHIVFLGFGPMDSVVKDYAARHCNIHFLPAVPQHELRRYTQSGDVGLCLIEPKCLSYKFCMPNKLFEYLGAGIPAIVSNLPELGHIVGSSGAGWVIDHDPRQLRDVVSSIERAEIADRGKKALEWTRCNTWSAETENLQRMYLRLNFPVSVSP